MSDSDFGETGRGNNPEQPPIDWFIEKRHGHSANDTQDNVRNYTNFFKNWLKDQIPWVIYKNDDKRTISTKREKWGDDLQHEQELDWTTGGIYPQDLSIDGAHQYFQALAAHPNLSGATEAQHVGTVRQFYDFCLNRSHSWFTKTGNPIQLAIEEGGDKIIGDMRSRNPALISVSEMSEYIRSWRHPLWEAITAFLAKSTARRGVVHNLDLQDVYLDHPSCNWGIHKTLRRKDRPFLHISPKPRKGDYWNERNRTPAASNKTNVHRTIPIDNELRNLFLRWLVVHPGPMSGDTPFFVSLNDDWGERISATTVLKKIRAHSEDLGYWYGTNDDDNINVHYFRHWATSVIDERLEAALRGQHATTTKLLRGDQEDTMDNYTHWSDPRVEHYLDICPTFYE